MPSLVGALSLPSSSPAYTTDIHAVRCCWPMLLDTALRLPPNRLSLTGVMPSASHTLDRLRLVVARCALACPTDGLARCYPLEARAG